jgi:hypothetical protein
MNNNVRELGNELRNGRRFDSSSAFNGLVFSSASENVEDEIR